MQSLKSFSLWIALALVVIWGANFSVQKFVFNAVSPAGFLLVRYALILPVCATLMMLWVYGRRWPKLTRADFWLLARLGFVGHAMHVGIVTFGIYWSTPFSSSLILAIGPVFTLLILRLTTQEKLSGFTVVGVCVALAGALVFMSEKLVLAVTSNQGWLGSAGDLTLVFAAFLFSLYTVQARAAIVKLGSVQVMGYSTLINFLPIALIAAPVGLQTDWLNQSPMVWLGLFYSIVISAFIGWLIWGWVNLVRGAAKSAPLMYLMPPVAGLVAWLTVGETFTWLKILGAVITLAGVAIAQFSTTTKPLTNAAPIE
jgi:drug/metabolite transporter (DMT)-like permease